MTVTRTEGLDAQRLAVVVEGSLEPGGPHHVELLAEAPSTDGAVADVAWQLIVGDDTIVVESYDSASRDKLESVISALSTEFGVAASQASAGSSSVPTGQPVVALRNADEGIAALLHVSASSAMNLGSASVDQGGQEGLLSLGMLRDVPLEVSAELGRTRLSVADVLQLKVGSVVELDRAAGAPVDVIVNGASIAKGEVVVIDEEYGIRITDILGRVSDTIA